MMDKNTAKRLLKMTQEGQLDCLRRHLTVTDENKRHVLLAGSGGGHGGSGGVRGGSGRGSGDSLLHVAARHGHVDVVRFLVETLRMDLETVNGDYKTAMHEAASRGQHGCVAYLLRQGATVDCLKKADWTPLMMACAQRHGGVVEELLSFGADPTLTNKDGWSSFHVACREGDAPIVTRLLAVSPHDVWRTESTVQRTPLHTAAMHGCTEVVGILLQRCGFAPDSPDSCGVTPFMDAVRNGHIAVARLLLSNHKASPTLADRLGCQPVHQVAVTGHQEALLFLVRELGADVNQKATSMELTALHYAAKEGHTAMIETLLTLGADLFARDVKGRTALHMACIAQRAETAELLLKSGLEDTEDSTGATARQYARKPPLLRLFEM